MNTLRHRIEKLLNAVLLLDAEPPDLSLDDGEFVNLVAQNLGMPVSTRQELLERDSLVERARARWTAREAVTRAVLQIIGACSVRGFPQPDSRRVRGLDHRHSDTRNGTRCSCWRARARTRRSPPRSASVRAGTFAWRQRASDPWTGSRIVPLGERHLRRTLHTSSLTIIASGITRALRTN